MLELIGHIIDISARRDRTEINSAMVDALIDLFGPLQLTIYRCYPGKTQTVVFSCAGLSPNGTFVRNAYLPDRRYCFTVDQAPLLNRCLREKSAVMEVHGEGSHRIVFPVDSMGKPLYLIDLVLSDHFSADRRAGLMGLIEYFGNHIDLLDYGEADTLTGLSSRKTFEKHLYELLGQSAVDTRSGSANGPARRRGGEQGSHWLAVCDIDHFKLVNDTFGHLIGDEVLIMLAQTMRDAFRFDDQLFRFGGEEFVILLQPTEQGSAFNTLERFRREVENQVFSRVGHVTISIGFSHLLPNDTPSDAIERADAALYFAKRHGRNRVACHEELIATGKIAAKEITHGEVELFN